MSHDGGANCFRLPPDSGIDTLNALPDLNYRMAPGHPIVIERTYFDSFDWRLYARQRRLYLKSHPPRKAWVLVTPRQTLSAETDADDHRSLPARDLPEALGAGLSTILDMRALMPMIGVRIHRTPVDCLDVDGKTVIRLHIDRFEVREDHRGPWRRFDTRCRLLPMKGYDKPLRHLRRRLSAIGTPCPDDTMSCCLHLLGIETGRYSPRPRLRLAPDMRSDQAMKTVLTALHDVMNSNLNGILEDTDSEFLHDFRTAIRRSRTALGQIRRVFPARRTERLLADFAWLGSVTTPLRDLDVHLLDFPVYRERLPKALRTAFEPLRGQLDARREVALMRLRHVLRDHRFQYFMRDWQAFLEAPPPPRTRLDNARLPIRTTSAKRIRKLYERICADGTAIDEHSPPEALHALRKRCKKLRYLLELFESCLVSPDSGEAIAALKDLQDLLGGYQDCHVQAEALAGFKTEAENPEFAAAIDWLLTDLGERQTRLREAFHETIDHFASTGHRAMIRALTKLR